MSPAPASFVPGPPPPLDPEAAEALGRLARRARALSRPSLVPAAAALVEWLSIAALVASTFWIDALPYWLLAAALIGTRQHGLLILMHEGVHRRLHRDATVNDWLSDVLCAWPMFTSTAAYRAGHLRHHNALHTPDDPDWIVRHDQPQWAFPMPAGRLARILASIALGGGVHGFFRANRRLSPRGASVVADARPLPAQLARAAAAFALPTAALAAGEGPRLLILWLLPIVTVLPLYVRIRVIAEHYGLPGRSPLDATRDWTGGALGDALLVPWNIRLHLTHHLFPSVPFHRLPEMQRALHADPVLGSRCHRTEGLRALLGELTRPDQR